MTIGVVGGPSSKDNPAQGQFLSPDTLVPDAGLVLDYNRYMYARGNPVKYTDPTGHFTEDQLIEWYGENWRDLFSKEWIDILLDVGGEIARAQLGDLLLMGGRQYVFALDGSNQLSLWDVQAKAGYRFAAESIGQTTTSDIALYRRLGDESGAGRPYFSNRGLGATNGAGAAEYQMQRIVGVGAQSITLDGDWWMGNGLGQFVHSQQAFSGWNWGNTWAGKVFNLSVTGGSAVAAGYGAFEFVKGGAAGQSLASLGMGAFSTLIGAIGVASTVYNAAQHRSTYQIMSCSDLASFCN